LIDDIANTLTGLAAWSDGDANITNDQSDDSWRNNGRVLQNANTGTYLLMYVSVGDNFQDDDSDELGGVRFVRSSAWDGTNSLPSTDTTAHEYSGRGDPFVGDANFDDTTEDRNASFTNDKISRASGLGLWFFNDDNFGYGSRATAATDASVTYFISGTADGLSVGAWNSTDGNYGAASHLTWQHCNNKFWADGHTAVAMYAATTSSRYPYHMGHYAYQWAADRQRSNHNDSNYEGVIISSGMRTGKWGFINPASGDDTFFVAYPTVFQESSSDTPVTYARQLITNQKDSGAAHGDTITYDTTDYRIMQESGAANSNALSVGLRYE
jgi:hypothetical protein